MAGWPGLCASDARIDPVLAGHVRLDVPSPSPFAASPALAHHVDFHSNQR